MNIGYYEVLNIARSTEYILDVLTSKIRPPLVLSSVHLYPPQPGTISRVGLDIYR